VMACSPPDPLHVTRYLHGQHFGRYVGARRFA